MAVESKKNESSAEKNVKKESTNGDDYAKLNGEGEFFLIYHISYPLGQLGLPRFAAHTHTHEDTCCAYIYSYIFSTNIVQGKYLTFFKEMLFGLKIFKCC